MCIYIYHTINDYIYFVTIFTNRIIVNEDIGILSLECIDIILMLAALRIFIFQSFHS